MHGGGGGGGGANPMAWMLGLPTAFGWVFDKRYRLIL
jgi:hypothetical protein